MTSNDSGDNKKSSTLSQIVSTIVITLCVGGTSPWWFNKIFSTTDVSDTPQVSRSYFIGRWEVQQSFNQTNGETVSGENVVDYFENGRFEGKGTIFRNNQGNKNYSSGHWEFEKLSDKTFRLKLNYDNGIQWQGSFKMIDQNRIQNIDLNYIVDRIN
jgi:hypothetical protein